PSRARSTIPRLPMPRIPISLPPVLARRIPPRTLPHCSAEYLSQGGGEVGSVREEIRVSLLEKRADSFYTLVRVQDPFLSGTLGTQLLRQRIVKCGGVQMTDVRQDRAGTGRQATTDILRGTEQLGRGDDRIRQPPVESCFGIYLFSQKQRRECP